jgi:hypothetical protein
MIGLITNLLATTVRKWWDDNPWRLSAALSYYTLFSLAPLLTLAVAGAAVVVEETVVQGELLPCCTAPGIRFKAPSPLSSYLYPFHCLYGHVQ